MGSLTACSQPLTAHNNRDIEQAIVPGWNEYVKEHHDDAMDAYWLWLEMGKPSHVCDHRYHRPHETAAMLSTTGPHTQLLIRTKS